MIPQLIIFDCDGVLIDSESLAYQGCVEILAEYGIQMTLDEALQKYAGRSDPEGKDTVSLHEAALPPEYFQKRRERQKKLFEMNLKPMAGIYELVDSITIKKCVASNSSPDRLKYTLDLAELWDRFAPNIFSAAQVKKGKPAPDLFLFAAAQMAVSPRACLVIEDSLSGVQAARAAGMPVYGFVGGAHCGAGQCEALRQAGAREVFRDLTVLTQALALDMKGEFHRGN